MRFLSENPRDLNTRRFGQERPLPLRHFVEKIGNQGYPIVYYCHTYWCRIEEPRKSGLTTRNFSSTMMVVGRLVDVVPRKDESSSLFWWFLKCFPNRLLSPLKGKWTHSFFSNQIFTPGFASVLNLETHYERCGDKRHENYHFELLRESLVPYPETCMC